VIYVGTSGWMYKGWRRLLYAGIPQRRWLAHAATVFGALEINGSFYGQIAPATFRRWRSETPETFKFALKGHRFITHYKRLRDVTDSVRRVRDPARELGDRLAVVVWQLPSTLQCDLERLDGFLVALEEWPETRHSIEFRHRSWFTDAVAQRLERARVANCMGDAPDFPLWSRVTTDLVHVRLHGHTRKYASSYSRAHLSRWAATARGWAAEGREVHIYLDNDAEGAAIRNALTLRALVGEPSHFPITTAGRSS
jgi:uncharacterized protein YecE (DUF72 family)